MLTIIIRTDKPEAEIGLYESGKQIAYLAWPAHRELAESIHLKINQLLKEKKFSLKDIKAVAVYKGPGSFTGLRIGLSVANALAKGLEIPIVAAGGSDWIESCLQRLASGQNDGQALPEYGSPPHITKPKH